MQPQGTSGGANSRPFEYYRAFQKVFVERPSGDVVLRFHRTDVVRVRPTGDVLLTTGGYLTQTTLLSMNDALQPMGMALEAGGGGAAAGGWTLRFDDGSSCAYRDGMVVRSRGGADAGRGRAMLEAYSGTPVPPGVLPQAPAAAGPGPASSSAAAAAAAAQAQAQAQAAAAAAQARRAAPQARVTGMPGAGAALRAAAPAVPAATGGAQQRAAAPGYHPQHAQHPQHHPHAPAAGGHAPRAADPEAVARQLAALAVQAGMHADEELDDDDACVICLAAARDVVLVPCGHNVLCLRCCGDVKAGSNQCPVCREEILEAVHVG